MKKASMCIALLAFFAGFSFDARADKPRVGFSMVLSGAWASWGTPVKNGLELGLADRGNPFDLEVQDDQCEATHALSNVLLFSQKNIKVMLVGCIETMDAIAPVAQKNNAIVIGLGGMTDSIVQRHSNVLGFLSLVDTEAHYLVPYLNATNVKTLAIVHGVNAFGDVVGPSLQALAEKSGITVTSRQDVPMETPDFQTIGLRAIKANPDGIYIHQSPGSTGLFVRQLRGLGYKGRIFSGFWFESDEMLQSAGKAAEGVEYTYPLNNPADQKSYDAFAARYQARFHSAPNSDAAMGYDLAGVLAQALKKCASTDAMCVKDFFHTLGTFDGMDGKATMQPDNAVIRPYGIKQFKNGSYQWLRQDIKPAA